MVSILILFCLRIRIGIYPLVIGTLLAVLIYKSLGTHAYSRMCVGCSEAYVPWPILAFTLIDKIPG